MSEPFAEWLDVGQRSFVRIHDIVAIYDGFYDEEIDNLAIEPIRSARVYAIVVLRGGQTLPSYASARTLRQRLQEIGPSSVAAASEEEPV